MSNAKRRVGYFSQIISIIISVILIGLVVVTLFGNMIIEQLSESAEINLSSFTGYLPMNDEGVPNGVIYYVIGGIEIEPQAIILQVLICVGTISVVLSLLSLIFRKGFGRKIAAAAVALLAVGAIGLFIYTYDLSVDGKLWSDISGFFTSVFTIGLQGGVAEGAFGSFAVFTTYLLISGLGISSFLVSLVND
ncbi:MAG: hypothetical protein LBP79_05565 [Clostridiales bacterium]|jgi:hypothetical protein|nr:hypothetical protein [Clostridiales bacterium]